MNIQGLLLTILTITLVVSPLSIQAATDECPIVLEMEAIDVAGVSHRGGWDGVYSAFNIYGPCDDGAIAEGFSYSIMTLLAQAWESLPRLSELLQNDSQFDKFLFRHIDATASRDELQTIISNSRNCLANYEDLCGRILVAAEEAMRNL